MQQKIHEALHAVSVGQKLAREKFMELYNEIFSKSIGDSELYTIIIEEVDSITLLHIYRKRFRTRNTILSSQTNR
jgi:hypothetical protein